MSALLDGVRVALGELYPADVLAQVWLEPPPAEHMRGVVCFPAAKVLREHARRAIRLTIVHMEGPDALAVCDAHAIARREADCARVPVRDALRGHVCGVK